MQQPDEKRCRSLTAPTALMWILLFAVSQAFGASVHFYLDAPLDTHGCTAIQCRDNAKFPVDD